MSESRNMTSRKEERTIAVACGAVGVVRFSRNHGFLRSGKERRRREGIERDDKRLTDLDLVILPAKRFKSRRSVSETP